MGKKKNPGELVVLGLHGNPKTRRAKKKAASRAKKRNSLKQAKDLYQRFHGKDADEVLEAHREAEVRRDYTALGPLVAIGVDAFRFEESGFSEDDIVNKWDQLPHVRFPQGKALLGSSPDGGQLYILGDDQEIDLDEFETDTAKDLVDLGDATFIVYTARKGPSFDAVDWVHTFGEEGGMRPRLVFDRLSRWLLLVGGSYHVDAPGIVD